jgi:putative tryptophan/tyrosine transport system substrate-binding protein
MDFERVFAIMAHEHPRAFLLITDGLTLQHAQQIVDFVTRNRIPSMFDHLELVVAEALMGYGPSVSDLWRRAASYVDTRTGGTSKE